MVRKYPDAKWVRTGLNFSLNAQIHKNDSVAKLTRGKFYGILSVAKTAGPNYSIEWIQRTELGRVIQVKKSCTAHFMISLSLK